MRREEIEDSARKNREACFRKDSEAHAEAVRTRKEIERERAEIQDSIHQDRIAKGVYYKIGWKRFGQMAQYSCMSESEVPDFIKVLLFNGIQQIDILDERELQSGPSEYS